VARRFVALLGSVALVATLGGPAARAQLLLSTRSVHPRAHVMVVVFENKGYHQIIGNSQASYFNRLAHRYALATRYHAVVHPSLPDYLALTGGSTFGIRSDCTTCTVQATNLGDQLEASGFTWKIYAESMPSPCYEEAWNGRYAKKHVPFLYYRNITGHPRRCKTHVVPLRRLWRNLAHHAAPNFSFVVPNLCHDMHDCSVATGNAWLRSFMKRVLATRAFSRHGVVVVTFDEDHGTAANRVATVVVNGRAAPGRKRTAYYTHYSLLRSVETVFGLEHLGLAGRSGLRPLPLGPLP
jgi:phosphatidylinositol-3-phosphatase